MRSIIKKILNEDVKLDRLHTYFLKKWESQVKSGQKPKIDYIDTIRKGLGDFIIQIDDWYFDFVGGEENAYKLFIEELKDLVIFLTRSIIKPTANSLVDGSCLINFLSFVKE